MRLFLPGRSHILLSTEIWEWASSTSISCCPKIQCSASASKHSRSSLWWTPWIHQDSSHTLWMILLTRVQGSCWGINSSICGIICSNQRTTNMVSWPIAQVHTCRTSILKDFHESHRTISNVKKGQSIHFRNSWLFQQMVWG